MNPEDPTPQKTPFLVFHGGEAAVVKEIQDGQMILGDPELGNEVTHQIPLSELGTTLSIKPLCGDLEKLGKWHFMTHHEAVLDPLIQQMPHILDIHRILEKCTSRPSLRVKTRVSPDKQSYNLGYPLKVRRDDVSIIPLTCYVWFTPHYVIFSTPEPKNRLSLPEPTPSFETEPS